VVAAARALAVRVAVYRALFSFEGLEQILGASQVVLRGPVPALFHARHPHAAIRVRSMLIFKYLYI
jgi:hypothetical protein